MKRSMGWTHALLCALALGAMLAARAAEPKPAPANPIVTQAQLDAYFAASPDNPFDALSAGARERFLSSVRFGHGGLASMDPNELADELDDAQIHALLTLFGEAVLAYAPKSRVHEIRAVERRVTKREGLGPVERRYTDFYKAIHDVDAADTEAEARAIGELFDAQLAALYEPAALRGVDDHELRMLRLGARAAAMRTRQRPHVEAFERMFAERVRRDLVSTEDVASLRDLFVALRRFGEARALAQKYPHAKLNPLPQMRDSLGKDAAPTVWRIEAGGKRLTRERVDLVPLQIVVTVSRSCRFSRDAAEDIPADELLGPIFERHALWVVQPPGFEPVGRAALWNEERPRAPVVALYDRSEWTLLPKWITPTFFFIRDGKVVDTASGWSRADPKTRDDLVAALRRTGLLPAH